MVTQLENIASFIGISLGIIGSIGSLFWFIKTATSKKVKLFNLEIERSLMTKESYSEIINSFKSDSNKDQNLGIDQLVKYYTQISQQTKINY